MHAWAAARSPRPPRAASHRRLHFVLVVLYNVYAMCILFWHFRRYVIIRQTYLTRGAAHACGERCGRQCQPLALAGCGCSSPKVPAARAA